MSANDLANLPPAALAMLVDVPAMVAPDGTTSNLANPKNNSEPLFVVTSLLLGLMILFIINRFYVKAFMVKKYSLDDRKRVMKSDSSPLTNRFFSVTIILGMVCT
jgi:hypothetical protein